MTKYQTRHPKGKDIPWTERRSRDVFDDIPAGSCYFDQKLGRTIHKINEGGFCVLSRSDHVIMTTLGSCIAVCMYDPVMQVGGMNHFLLPEEKNNADKNTYNMRYGNHAMEVLLNEILKRGGQKERLVLKAFGGGNVLSLTANIGSHNQQFLKQYIADEGLVLDMCDLGGDFPRRLAFYPSSGNAYVKILRRVSDLDIHSREETYRQKAVQESHNSQIDLFQEGRT
ncbi:MAG: chemoreceptor glutamine deamidase CheD [Alphaproteobacteria bacterium]|nr:chemoreceptor glutamine deamidase CheD [Alphaproteobacteria bacterium]